MVWPLPVSEVGTVEPRELQVLEGHDAGREGKSSSRTAWHVCFTLGAAVFVGATAKARPKAAAKPKAKARAQVAKNKEASTPAAKAKATPAQVQSTPLSRCRSRQSPGSTSKSGVKRLKSKTKLQRLRRCKTADLAAAGRATAVKAKARPPTPAPDTGEEPENTPEEVAPVSKKVKKAWVGLANRSEAGEGENRSQG